MDYFNEMPCMREGGGHTVKERGGGRRRFTDYHRKTPKPSSKRSFTFQAVIGRGQIICSLFGRRVWVVGGGGQ